jgi:hypothetical protein
MQKCDTAGCGNAAIDKIEYANADGSYTVVFACGEHLPDPATLSQFDVIMPLPRGLAAEDTFPVLIGSPVRW